MKDRVILYLAGFSAETIAGLGVMLHQAMNVEATTRNDVNTATTQFTCSIVEDFTNKGEVKSCCWDGCVPASQCVPSDVPEVGQGER